MDLEYNLIQFIVLPDAQPPNTTSQISLNLDLNDSGKEKLRLNLWFKLDEISNVKKFKSLNNSFRHFKFTMLWLFLPIMLWAGLP